MPPTTAGYELQRLPLNRQLTIVLQRGKAQLQSIITTTHANYTVSAPQCQLINKPLDLHFHYLIQSNQLNPRVPTSLNPPCSCSGSDFIFNLDVQHLNKVSSSVSPSLQLCQGQRKGRFTAVHTASNELQPRGTATPPPPPHVLCECNSSSVTYLEQIKLCNLCWEAKLKGTGNTDGLRPAVKEGTLAMSMKSPTAC